MFREINICMCCQRLNFEPIVSILFMSGCSKTICISLDTCFRANHLKGAIFGHNIIEYEVYLRNEDSTGLQLNAIQARHTQRICFLLTFLAYLSN